MTVDSYIRSSSLKWENEKLIKLETGNTRIILRGKIEFQVIKIRMKGFTWEQTFSVPQKLKQLTQWVVLKTAG